MILMKGSNRILEKPLVEQNNSTSSLKLLSIYGITSYSQLVGIPLTILNSTGSDTTINININNLGNIPLIYEGSANLPSNAIISNSIYIILYNGTNFVLQANLSTSSGPSNITIQDSVLSLTNASTSSDITTAFGSQADMENFMNSLDSLNTYFLVSSNPNENLIVLDVKTNFYTSNNINYEDDTIQVIVPSTKKLVTLTFTREAYDDTYTSVTKTEENLGGSSITVENSLVSDSQINPPSVHAVNEALGQIDTILTNILNS